MSANNTKGYFEAFLTLIHSKSTVKGQFRAQETVSAPIGSSGNLPVRFQLRLVPFQLTPIGADPNGAAGKFILLVRIGSYDIAILTQSEQEKMNFPEQM